VGKVRERVNFLVGLKGTPSPEEKATSCTVGPSAHRESKVGFTSACRRSVGNAPVEKAGGVGRVMSREVSLAVAEGESVRGPGRARGAAAKGWRGVGAVGKVRGAAARAK
jgi:hypothetical protein